MMPRRGEDNPWETRGNSDCRGMQGGDAGIQNLFIVKNIIYLVLRLPLNLLKCMYSHCIVLPKTGITLLIIKGALFVQNHPLLSSFAPSLLSLLLTLPQDNIFRAASLLLQMISADGGPGGEPMRRLASPLLLPLLATKLRLHQPLVLRLSRPV